MAETGGNILDQVRAMLCAHDGALKRALAGAAAMLVAAFLLEFRIQFTDEAHQTYFGTTEYTIGVPDVAVSTAL